MEVSDFCKVVYKDGFLVLTDVKGNILPFQQSIKIENDCEHRENEAVAIVRLLVDISKLEYNG